MNVVCMVLLSISINELSNYRYQYMVIDIDYRIIGISYCYSCTLSMPAIVIVIGISYCIVDWIRLNAFGLRLLFYFLLLLFLACFECVRA